MARPVALTPMKQTAARQMRATANTIDGDHPETVAGAHVRDAAKVLEHGSTEGAKRHLDAAMEVLTPRNLVRHGIKDDEGHALAKHHMGQVHRHRLAVQDIEDAHARNNQLRDAVKARQQAQQAAKQQQAPGGNGSVPPQPPGSNGSGSSPASVEQRGSDQPVPVQGPPGGAPTKAQLNASLSNSSGGILLSARTAMLERTPAPRGRPGGPGLYDVKGMGHTDYLQQIVKALIEKRGMEPGKAYAIARGAIRKWMRGGGHVHPEVRAAAGRAEASELARQARAHAHSSSTGALELAFNPLEKRGKGGEWLGGATEAAAAGAGMPLETSARHYRETRDHLTAPKESGGHGLVRDAVERVAWNTKLMKRLHEMQHGAGRVASHLHKAGDLLGVGSVTESITNTGEPWEIAETLIELATGASPDWDDLDAVLGLATRTLDFYNPYHGPGGRFATQQGAGSQAQAQRKREAQQVAARKDKAGDRQAVAKIRAQITGLRSELATLRSQLAAARGTTASGATKTAASKASTKAAAAKKTSTAAKASSKTASTAKKASTSSASRAALRAKIASVRAQIATLRGQLAQARLANEPGTAVELAEGMGAAAAWLHETRGPKGQWIKGGSGPKPATPAPRFATLPRGDKAPKQIARYGSGMVAQVSGYREQITGEAHITQHELEVRLEAQRHEFMAQIAQIQAKAVTKEDAEQRIITHTKGVLAQVRKEHDQRAEAETEEDRKRRRKAFAIHAGIIVGGTVIACLLLAVGLPAVPALAAGAGPPLIQELVDMIAKLS
jgi:hypothetical protein